VCIIAKAIEAQGMSTVALVVARKEQAEREGTPRGLFVKFPFGAPLGPPGDTKTHWQVLRAALQLLETATCPLGIVDAGIPWRQG